MCAFESNLKYFSTDDLLRKSLYMYMYIYIYIYIYILFVAASYNHVHTHAHTQAYTYIHAQSSIDLRIFLPSCVWQLWAITYTYTSIYIHTCTKSYRLTHFPFFLFVAASNNHIHTMHIHKHIHTCMHKVLKTDAFSFLLFVAASNSQKPSKNVMPVSCCTYAYTYIHAYIHTYISPSKHNMPVS